MLDKQQLEVLIADVREYAAAHDGKIYAPICHPAFADVHYHHGPERYELIGANIPEDAETALDIGAHWGYFSHRLEDDGLRVTAAEMNKSYLQFLTKIRELCDKKFEIYNRSVFEMSGAIRYDVILALNIFHHFIKTQEIFETFVEFLSRFDSTIIFFQAHNPKEGQMTGAYRNFEPDEFAEFVRDAAGMKTIKQLGAFGQRPMYAIT